MFWSSDAIWCTLACRIGAISARDDQQAQERGSRGWHPLDHADPHAGDRDQHHKAGHEHGVAENAEHRAWRAGLRRTVEGVQQDPRREVRAAQHQDPEIEHGHGRRHRDRQANGLRLLAPSVQEDSADDQRVPCDGVVLGRIGRGECDGAQKYPADAAVAHPDRRVQGQDQEEQRHRVECRGGPEVHDDPADCEQQRRKQTGDLSEHPVAHEVHQCRRREHE